MGPIRFDIFMWQVVPWGVLREDALYLESLGFGTLWIGDAFLLPDGYGKDVSEAWTTLAALAACTHRIGLGTAITNVGLRHPAMLAKQAATVDQISGGRLSLGLGAGIDSAADRTALDLADLSRIERVNRLAETVEIVDGLLRGRHLKFQGKFFQLDARVEPLPVQQPRPPLAIGGTGYRSLEVVAGKADIWVSDAPWRTLSDALARTRECNRFIDERCSAVGREPAAVERACVFGWSPSGAPFESRDAFEEFVGSFHDAGITRFIFSFGGESTPEPYKGWVDAGQWATCQTLEHFAADCMKGLATR